MQGTSTNPEILVIIVLGLNTYHSLLLNSPSLYHPPV